MDLLFQEVQEVQGVRRVQEVLGFSEFPWFEVFGRTPRTL
jgi:hypothetical protein